MNSEEHKRSVVKALTYRILVIALDFFFVLVLTKRTDLALGFVVGSNIYSTFAYYAHERAWNKIKWGIKSA